MVQIDIHTLFINTAEKTKEHIEYKLNQIIIIIIKKH